jgi:hypothetical protein
VALLVILGAPIVRHSAMVQGLDIVPIASQLRGSAIIRNVRPLLAVRELEGAHVHLALPIAKGPAGEVKRWLERTLPKAHLYVGVVSAKGDGERMGRVVDMGGERKFVFGADAAPDKKWAKAAGDDGFPLRLLGARDHGAVFVYPDPDGQWQVERVGRRVSGAPDEPDMEVEEAEDRDDPVADPG